MHFKDPTLIAMQNLHHVLHKEQKSKQHAIDYASNLHQSYLKSPLPVKLTWQKMHKILFYDWKNSQNTSSAQLC